MTTRPRRPDHTRRGQDHAQGHAFRATPAQGAPETGLRIFLMLLMTGLLLTTGITLAGAAWLDRTGRQSVEVAGERLMPPKAGVHVWAGGERAREGALVIAPLQALSAQEDMLAPVAKDGPLAIRIAPRNAASGGEGCGAFACQTAFAAGEHWIVATWPASLGAPEAEMRRHVARLIHRWRLRGEAATAR
jgi:hypothetical protein